MKPHIDVEDIITRFTILPPEIDFLGRNKPHNHFGKALLLKFFQAEGRFPEGENELVALHDSVVVNSAQFARRG